jgi:hypothetical protein
MRAIFVSLIFYFFSWAQASADFIEEKKILGIVALAPLCYWDCEGYDIPLPLYYEPNLEDSPATFLLHEDIEHWPEFEEYEYEQAGALVYELKNDWYQIIRNEEFLWVHKENAGAYYSYPKILKNRLTFLTDETAKIWENPGELPREIGYTFPKRYTGEVPVIIKELKLHDGEWWILVEVLKKSPCLTDDKTIITTGWVPAYLPDNKASLWYYSRGC